MAGGRNKKARRPGPTTRGPAVPGRQKSARSISEAPSGRNQMPKDGAPGDGADGSDPKDAAMDQLKWEVAGELSLDDDLQDPDDLTVREAGKIGGNMVKRLVEKGKSKLKNER